MCIPKITSAQTPTPCLQQTCPRLSRTRTLPAGPCLIGGGAMRDEKDRMKTMFWGKEKTRTRTIPAMHGLRKKEYKHVQHVIKKEKKLSCKDVCDKIYWEKKTKERTFHSPHTHTEWLITWEAVARRTAAGHATAKHNKQAADKRWRVGHRVHAPEHHGMWTFHRQEERVWKVSVSKQADELQRVREREGKSVSGRDTLYVPFIWIYLIKQLLHLKVIIIFISKARFSS
jgi:hypothetical protein